MFRRTDYFGDIIYRHSLSSECFNGSIANFRVNSAENCNITKNCQEKQVDLDPGVEKFFKITFAD